MTGQQLVCACRQRFEIVHRRHSGTGPPGAAGDRNAAGPPMCGQPGRSVNYRKEAQPSCAWDAVIAAPAAELKTGRYPEEWPSAVGWYESPIGHVTELSQPSPEQSSWPPNWPRTSAKPKPALEAAVEITPSRMSAAAFRAVRLVLLRPMQKLVMM